MLSNWCWLDGAMVRWPLLGPVRPFLKILLHQKICLIEDFYFENFYCTKRFYLRSSVPSVWPGLWFCSPLVFWELSVWSRVCRTRRLCIDGPSKISETIKKIVFEITIFSIESWLSCATSSKTRAFINRCRLEKFTSRLFDLEIKIKILKLKFIKLN